MIISRCESISLLKPFMIYNRWKKHYRNIPQSFRIKENLVRYEWMVMMIKFSSLTFAGLCKRSKGRNWWSFWSWYRRWWCVVFSLRLRKNIFVPKYVKHHVPKYVKHDCVISMINRKYESSLNAIVEFLHKSTIMKLIQYN